MRKNFVIFISIFSFIAASLLNGQVHFQPIWNTESNPYNAMNIYLIAGTVNGSPLENGDEIGIFDGDNCVGARLVSDTSPFSTPLSIITSTDDPTTNEIDGFISGNTIVIKIWSNSLGQIIEDVEIQIASGNNIFQSNATLVISNVSGILILPSIPELISPTNNSPNISLTPNLDWNSSSDAESYELQVSESEQFTSSVINQNGLTNTEYSVPTSVLSYSTKYHWRVRAVNMAGNSDWSTVWNFTTESEPIPLPSVPELTAPDDNATNVILTPTLDWNNSSDAVTYEVQLSVGEDFTITLVNQIGLTTTDYTIPVSTLSYATQYHWRVRAANTTGNSEWSTVWSFTTEAEPIPLPGVPQLVSPDDNSPNVSLTPTLDWNSSSDAVTYEVQLSVDEQFGSTLINSTALTSTEYLVPASTLSYATQYYWKVRAVNTTGNSEWSTVWKFTTLDFIVSPKNLVGIADYGKITLNWDDLSDNETNFVLERESPSKRSYEIIATLPINTETYTDESVDSNTPYNYRVKAINDNTESEYSNILEITSTNTSVLAPSNLTAVQLTPGVNTVYLEWLNNEDNQTGLILERKESNGIFSTLTELAASVSNYTDETVENGKAYSYRIKAHIYNFYFSEYSNIANVEIVVPVELTSFYSIQENTNVVLYWETASELNNMGFDIEIQNAENWSKIAFIEGHGTTTQTNNYEFRHAIKNIGTSKLVYRLKQIDYDGNFSYSDEIELDFKPTEYMLSQNYPNPFNPSTKIEYSILEKQSVHLEVFNLLGESVSVLVDEVQDQGFYEVNFDASKLSTGIYYYRIQSGSFIQTKKMLLIK